MSRPPKRKCVLNRESTKAQSENNPSYAKNYSRVSKECISMLIALWMQDFVDDDDEGTANQVNPHKKVGAVLVQPDGDVILGADCSRGDVHAVVRLLTTHHDKAKGCKMFITRKPCSGCAKLLVQSGVQCVLYLPYEPEYYESPNKKTRKEKKEIDAANSIYRKEVDKLFSASPIGHTPFVFEVDKSILQHAAQKTPLKTKSKKRIREEKKRLRDKFSLDENWMKSIEKELPYPTFNEIKEQIQVWFDNAMQWVARANVISCPWLNYEFKLSKDSEERDKFDPVGNGIHKKQARLLMTIARILAQRTDDPKTGVGAVILSRSSDRKILSFGWNGFPAKARYGEFPRASKHDESDLKKYPYVIHAEQNAILKRNEDKIGGAILFVTKTPCDKCSPILAMHGIGTVVVDEDVMSCKAKDGYKKFPDLVEKDRFTCYETTAGISKSTSTTTNSSEREK